MKISKNPFAVWPGAARRLALMLPMAALLVAWAPRDARADYPDRPIKLVIPYTPGGPADVLGRYIAQKMGQALGKPVVVENKPGAGLAVGADYVARAEPNGYTVLLGAASMLVATPSGRKPADNLRDFAPISMIGVFPQVLVVNRDLPVKDVQGLVAYAKAHPGEINYGSSGIGSLVHLAGALFASMAGVQMTHVPYRGVNEALTDLVAGRVQVSFPGAPIALPLMKSGQVRALAVTGAGRSETAPSLPTIAESGLPGYAVNPWYGLMAPRGTPQAIIDRWHDEVAKIMQTPEVRQRWLGLGADPAYSRTPAEFGDMMKNEADRWAGLIESAHIELQ